MDICTTLGIHIKPHVKHSSLIFGTVMGHSHSHMGHMGSVLPFPHFWHRSSIHMLAIQNTGCPLVEQPIPTITTSVELENQTVFGLMLIWKTATISQQIISLIPAHGKNQTVFETSQHLPTPLRHWHGHYFCNPNPNRRLRALCSHLTRSYHSWNLPWVEICCLHWSSSTIEIAVCRAAAICCHDNTRLALVLLYVNI